MDTQESQYGLTGIKVMSFNILGSGFCALPGPVKQWSYLTKLLSELLPRRSPGPGEISIVGLQEDVFVLKESKEWEDHTTDGTHCKFERLSFTKQEMEANGFELISFAVHDGLSCDSRMLIKDPDGQLEALTDERHRSLFVDQDGARTCTKPNQMKLGNSIWIKKGVGLETWTVRGDFSTFDTWEEAHKRDLVEYSLVPSRSAAKATFSKDGKDVFVVATCHLAGGKFDDRWLLTGDALTDISSQMLHKFASCGDLPTVLFGDTNMKHHTLIDKGMYDGVIRGMLFGTKDPSQITSLSPAYEAHKKYLLRIGDGEKVTETEVKALRASGKTLEDLAKVYDIEMSGAIDQAAVDLLFQRAKRLWRIREIEGMQLISPPSDQASSCLFGGVIDHIFYKGLELQEDSYCIEESNTLAMIPPGPEVKAVFDRIRASDHFPVMADFVLK